jgi:hypothetical protein
MIIMDLVLCCRRMNILSKTTIRDKLFLDEPVVDPVYETLRIAAETRKMTLANYLQQRQQTLNKQTSLNSQGSSELDIQPSPRVSRHTSRTETEITPSLRPPLPTPYPSPLLQQHHHHHHQSQQQQQQQQQHQQQTSATSLGKRYLVEQFVTLIETYQMPSRQHMLMKKKNSS